MILLPRLNPIRLIQENHRYQKYFSESIPGHEEPACYAQPFNRYDEIRFQVHTGNNEQLSFGATIESLQGKSVLSIEYVALPNSIYNTYEFSSPLSKLSPGLYLVHLTVSEGPGRPIQHFYSEHVRIENIHPNTIQILYTHDQNDYDILFHPSSGSQRRFMIRVEGGFASDGFTPAASDTVYRNQEFDTVLLSSKPYYTKKLTIGSGKGVPNWMADKINRVLSCSNVWLDGVRTTKSDGAKMEAVREKGVATAGWVIELIDADSSYSDVYGGGDYNIDYNQDYLL